MTRTFVAIGAVWGAVAIVAGAFGAHALRARLDAQLLAVFETGARYHMFAALALVGIGLSATALSPSRSLSAAGWLVLAGSVVFSGSLYALALSGVRVLGAITPLGGVLQIAGWLTWAWAAFTSR